MNSRNGKHHSGLLAQRNLQPKSYFDMFWRRKWWALPPAIIGMILTILYSFSLPPIYRSSTLIMIEPQKVSSTYVKSSVTIDVKDRLGAIRQQIMSRTNLERIIGEFNLYRPMGHGNPDRKGLVTRLKDRVKKELIALGLYEPSVSVTRQGGVPEEVVERMQKNIEVDVVGRGITNTFTIAYSEKDPLTVMRVTNKLASLFIEENLKVRERMVQETTKFLANQLQEARRKLENQEKTLREFKDQHMGALPEQIDANLKKLDRLQIELQTVNEALGNAEEKKLHHERQFESAKAMLMFETNMGITSENSLDLPGARLESLKEELSRLQGQFTDNYPDVILLKQQIKEMEAQYARGSTAPASVEPKRGAKAQTSKIAVQSAGSSKSSPSIDWMQGIQNKVLQAELQAALQTIDADITLLKEKQNKINSLIEDYERRVEDAYTNEQKLLELSRDYEISLANYQQLLKHRLGAELSEDLEKRQQGEQFRIVDPAHLPEVPVKPHRGGIILMGSVVSIGVGAGLALLVAYLTPAFHTPNDLQELFEQPVLATIPRSKISREDDLLVAVEEPDSADTEQYRMLYTKISEANKEKFQKIFAISSAVENEGKSLTALNLAVVMARDFGKKTLLLEGDLKRPSFPHYLRTEFKEGLVDILLGQEDVHSSLGTFTDTLIPFAVENLSVLPAAKSVRISSVLLSSQRMKNLLGMFREQYDYILVDAPPILPLSDMKIVAEVVDGVLLVVRAESTPQGALIKAVEDLKTEKLLGFVLNDVWRGLPHYYYHYSYYYHRKNSR